MLNHHLKRWFNICDVDHQEMSIPFSFCFVMIIIVAITDDLQDN